MTAAATTELSPLRRFWRYYQAGITNTAFGYSIYALLVAAGLNIYVAQIAAHVLGATFNYVTYSRHVFHDRQRSRVRFALSYAGNYLLGLAALAAATHVGASAYLAGFVSVVVVSLTNFFVLNYLVFLRRAK
jgi:putative flippase GtrA